LAIFLIPLVEYLGVYGILEPFLRDYPVLNIIPPFQEQVEKQKLKKQA